MNNLINDFFQQQLVEWDLAGKNYRGLQKALKRYIQLSDHVRVGVQFNPERIYSSAAKVDEKSIKERKCFLCRHHLPEQQRWIEYMDKYLVLVNPFPIFPRHLTIPDKVHTDQRLSGRFRDMLTLARELDGFIVFYNGPKCGASAPDHFHFQAGNKGFMPLEDDFEHLPKSLMGNDGGLNKWRMDNYFRTCMVLESQDQEKLAGYLEDLLLRMKTIDAQDPEPMLNVLVSWKHDQWRVFVFPRKKHRPAQYYLEGDQRILMSPASVDLGGMLITPREEDFHKMDANSIKGIFEQVCYDEKLFYQTIAE
ncbi:MAG: DUF4922 domain-containing protein [Bacteroidales bacterium]